MTSKEVGLPSLDELGKKFGTDKSTVGKNGEGGHDYLRVYESFLAPRRLLIKKVLEIGVKRGASVRVWEEYFPNAQIYGIDILPSAKQAESSRIKIELIDQGNQKDIEYFCKKNGPFDFIIEDGSHIWEHQISNIKWLLPHVTPGGVYVVEDLHTSYSKSGYGNPGEQTAIDFVQKCVDQILSGGEIRDQEIKDVHMYADTMMIFRRAAAFFRRSNSPVK